MRGRSRIILFVIVTFLWLYICYKQVKKYTDRNTLPQDREGYLWKVLQEKKATVGVEVGVYRGEFSSWMLTKWRKCEKYFLIDPWSVQNNYGEYWPKRKMWINKWLEKWRNKTKFIRMRSEDGAAKIANNSVDFVYLDARHDYCACKMDLDLFWPKLRSGGLLSGHDYEWWGLFLPSTVVDWIRWFRGTDWTLCENGKREYGSVNRAVDEFAQKNKLNVLITTEKLWAFPSWVIEKE